MLPVRVEGRALQVAVLGDRDDHVLVGDQVLDRDLPNLLADLGAPVGTELLRQRPQLVDDQFVQHILGTENLEIARDLLLEFLQLVQNLLPLHAGESLELEFDDRLRLPLGEVEGQERGVSIRAQEPAVVDLDLAHQSQLGVLRTLRGANQGDDLVNA